MSARIPLPKRCPNPTLGCLNPCFPRTTRLSHGVGIPESANEQGRLPQFASTGQVGLGVGTALCGNRESRSIFKPRCCVTFGKSPNLSGPPSPPLEERGLMKCPLRSKKVKAPQMPPAKAESRRPGLRMCRQHLCCAKFKVCFGGACVVALG